MRWIHPIVAGDAAEYVVGFLIVLAVVGLLANLPRRFPGPVTAAERSSSSRGWAGRFAGWGSLAFAIAAWLAILVVIAPIAPPRTAVLYSRARRAPVHWDHRLVRWDGGACEHGPARWIDLGTGVDDALARIDADRAVGSDEQARERARAALRDADALDATPIDAPDAAGHPDPAMSRLPNWLVESVELSIVLAQSRSRNLRQVIVAPGESRDLSGWRAAGAILSTGGVQLCLVDELDASARDTVEVRRMAFAHWIRSDGKLAVVLWALVDGRIVRARPLEFRVQLTPGEVVNVAGTIQPDADATRLVSVCIGGCAGHEAAIAVDDPRLAVARGVPQVVDALDPRGKVTASTAIRPARDARRPVLVAVPPSTLPWRALLDGAARSAYDAELLADELAALGVALPTTIASYGGDTSVHVIEAPGRIVVSRADSLHAAREWLASQRTAAAPYPLRVHDARVGVNTALSWMSLPITARTHPTPWLAPGAQVSAGMQGAALEQEPRPVRAQAGIVELVAHQAGGQTTRFVAIASDLHAQLADGEPFLVAATLRSIAWAAAWVSDPGFDEALATSSQRDEAHLRSVPLLRDEDHDEIRRRASRRGDGLAILLIGIHVLLAFRTLRGSR